MSAQLEFTGRRRWRVLIAASAGNFAEWCDWGVFDVDHRAHSVAVAEVKAGSR